MFCNPPHPKKNRAVCEITSTNMVEPDRPQMTILRMRIAWRITTATERVIVFQYFADRASQYIYLNINQLDALNFIIILFQASTCFEHHVLIVRRSKLYSGVITPIGGHPLHRLRDGTATYKCDDTRCCIVQFLTSWRWAHVFETCRGMK